MLKIRPYNLISYLFCLLSFIWLCKALFLGYYPDFNTQYYSAKYAFSGINPYLPNVGLYTPQVYPPSEFFFFYPFSVIPIGISSSVYSVFSVLALVFSLILLSKTFELKLFSKASMFLSGLTFLMFPVKFTLGMGQVNLFILLLLCIGIYFLKLKKDLWSGVAIGVAFIIKLFPVFIPIFFLSKLKIKIIVGFFGVVLVGVALPAAFLKVDILKTFLSSFIELIGSWKLDYYNQSLSGFIGRSFGVGQVASVLRFGISAIVSTVIFFFLWKHKNVNFTDLSFVFGILITLNLIINTFSWQHHFVLLIIPFYIVFCHLREIKARWFLYYLLGLSYFLTSVNMVNPNQYHVLYQSHVFYGTTILLGLMIYLYVEKKRST